MSENYPQPVKVQYGSFVFPQPTPYVSKTFSNEFKENFEIEISNVRSDHEGKSWNKIQ